jgi:hypothetical protein
LYFTFSFRGQEYCLLWSPLPSQQRESEKERKDEERKEEDTWNPVLSIASSGIWHIDRDILPKC